MSLRAMTVLTFKYSSASMGSSDAKTVFRPMQYTP